MAACGGGFAPQGCAESGIKLRGRLIERPRSISRYAGKVSMAGVCPEIPVSGAIDIRLVPPKPTQRRSHSSTRP